jgi:c-di-GMP-binding flagellar brake protein YcgR
MAGAERRKYERVDAKFDVELSHYSPIKGRDVSRDTHSSNVSAGGLLITTDFPLEISSLVHAKFTLIGTTTRRDVLARVVRVDEVESFTRYDIGLEFVETLSAEGILSTG